MINLLLIFVIASFLALCLYALFFLFLKHTTFLNCKLTRFLKNQKFKIFSLISFQLLFNLSFFLIFSFNKAIFLEFRVMRVRNWDFRDLVDILINMNYLFLVLFFAPFIVLILYNFYLLFLKVITYLKNKNKLLLNIFYKNRNILFLLLFLFSTFIFLVYRKLLSGNTIFYDLLIIPLVLFMSFLIEYTSKSAYDFYSQKETESKELKRSEKILHRTMVFKPVIRVILWIFLCYKSVDLLYWMKDTQQIPEITIFSIVLVYLLFLVLRYILKTSLYFYEENRDKYPKTYKFFTFFNNFTLFIKPFIGIIIIIILIANTHNKLWKTGKVERIDLYFFVFPVILAVYYNSIYCFIKYISKDLFSLFLNINKKFLKFILLLEFALLSIPAIVFLWCSMNFSFSWYSFWDSSLSELIFVIQFVFNVYFLFIISRTKKLFIALNYKKTDKIMRILSVFNYIKKIIYIILFPSILFIINQIVLTEKKFLELVSLEFIVFSFFFLYLFLGIKIFFFKNSDYFKDKYIYITSYLNYQVIIFFIITVLLMFVHNLFF